MQTFGKEVVLEIYSKLEDDRREIVLDATGLRIDFDINNTVGYNRGKFSIYNLNTETIKDISNGEKYVSLNIGIHGSGLYSLGEDFYISNATTETILPNTITTLYCMSGKRKSFLETQIHTNFGKSSLKEFIQIIIDEAKDSTINTEYILFPAGVLNYKAPSGKISRYSGSTESILNKLSKMFHFQYYLQGNTLRIVYKADTQGTYKKSEEGREGREFSVDALNLRANPIVGVGTIQLDINLTPDILPGDVFDTNDFITASNDLGIEYLAAVKNDMKSTVTKYSKFQVWNVIQRGSNYTDQWHTTVMGYTAKDGNRLSTEHFNWYGRD